MKKNTFSKTALWASLSLLTACGNPPKETPAKTEEKALTSPLWTPLYVRKMTSTTMSMVAG